MSPEAEQMQHRALGRVQAASFLQQEAGMLLTDAMRSFRKAGGAESVLVVETGLKLSVVRAIVTGKRTA